MAAGVVFALLAGCAIVDKYSERAIEYNLQAEKTQQQNLLLNIVRASLRRPMQFTGLTSITGTASASGTVGGGYTSTHQTPAGQELGSTLTQMGTAIGRVITGTGTASGSMSGGPTFTVPVLDTQEFYSGILTPVRSDTIDNYVQQGYQRSVLFDIFVANVEVIADNYPACNRFTFKNDVRNELNLSQFHALADYLVVSGFTTERIVESRPYGADVFVPRPRSAAEAALVMEALSKTSAAGLEARTDRQPGTTARQRPDEILHLRKRTSHARFCFARVGREKPRWLGNVAETIFCGQANRRDRVGDNRQHGRQSRPPQSPGSSPAPGQANPPVPRAQPAPSCLGAAAEEVEGEGGSAQFRGITLDPAFYTRIRSIQRKIGRSEPDENYFDIDVFKNHRVTFRFTVRSVEGILYYLGEISRQKLSPENNTAPRLAQVKTRLQYGLYPMEECDAGGTKNGVFRLRERRYDDKATYACENIFLLDKGSAPGAFYSVFYDGENYSIPSDPDTHGRSYQVLELAKQLLALHTSAKQLPQSSVISIIGGTAQ